MSIDRRTIAFIGLLLMGFCMGDALGDLLQHFYKHAELTSAFPVIIGPLFLFAAMAIVSELYTTATKYFIVAGGIMLMILAIADIKSYLSLALIHSAYAYHFYLIRRDLLRDKRTSSPAGGASASSH